MMALGGARVFDGVRILEGHSVVVEGRSVRAVLPDRFVPSGVTNVRVEGLLAPGFIDVQVNGGGGVLFNDHPTVEAIETIGAAHRKFGTTGFLPTFITDEPAPMRDAISAARAAVAKRSPGVLGIHLEGPFIAAERRGAHNIRYVRAITEEDIAAIVAPGEGKTLVTLAPEVVVTDAIAQLVAGGVIVAAGHTAASPEEIAEARAAGLTGYTHLFNAMPPLAGRAPGPVGAAMDDTEAYASIIVDLLHVAAKSLRAALAARGWERTMLITDAMPTVGSDMQSFELPGHTVTRVGDKLTDENGGLAGAHLDMATAVRNAVGAIGLPLEAALHMASGAPAAFLGLERRLGRIEPGYAADFVLLDDKLHVTETWIAGVASGEGAAA